MSVEYMHRPAALPQLLPDAVITNLMHIVYLHRPELADEFDLATVDGQAAFVDWFKRSSLRYYGVLPFVPVPGDEDTRPRTIPFARALKVLSDHVRRWARPLPIAFRRRARAVWLSCLTSLAQRFGKVARVDSAAADLPRVEPGANLIGYAFGELGMGEHVRMTATALEGQNVDFGVVNFTRELGLRQSAAFDSAALISENRYAINLFHINADQMLNAYCEFGDRFFEKRYNIGYWAWELSKCPDAWLPVIGLVDEIWAPSLFIHDCFREVTDKPVVLMPLCVELPDFTRMPRDYFGLPGDHYLFFSMFDFLSYIERKNPFAAIRAFLAAFPLGSEPVGLVLKVMNGDPGSRSWEAMIALVEQDARIILISETLHRHKLLALMDCCDSFVSLHRSEGFGRGPAEAMYLGKPVIVTNFSGNVDFTHSDNSLLVDYELVDVEPAEYPFSVGQTWADPDALQAARHMRHLSNDPAAALELGRRGQRYIRGNFNSKVIGERISRRLNEILEIF